ncbi:MAG: GNAT family N-acetyltransferase [Oscillospiraceae bacterium]|nr:GNAT family N-acetyltransferase [Oscillospiraceae bacterium]
MDIIYELEDIENLNKPEIPDDVVIRWQKVPDDYSAVRQYWLDKSPDWQSSVEEWAQWMEKEKSDNGCFYCAVFRNGKIIAIGSVEKYSENKWETAFVRTLIAERNKGYAKMVCYFVTKYILDSGKIATCRTDEENYPMRNVIKFLGFKEQIL